MSEAGKPGEGETPPPDDAAEQTKFNTLMRGFLADEEAKREAEAPKTKTNPSFLDSLFGPK